MQKAKFRVHVAINLNGGESIGEDHAGNPVIGDLKTNFQLAQDYQFLWGYDYPDFAEILWAEPHTRRMPKAEFKAQYHGLRKHYWMLSQGSESGLYGRNL